MGQHLKKSEKSVNHTEVQKALNVNHVNILEANPNQLKCVYGNVRFVVEIDKH